MFKGLSNFASMMKQAGQLSGRLKSLGEELKTKRATGSAGGGLVEVEVNGLGQVLKVTLAPALIERKDRELLEDLIPAAVNQAVEKAKELHAQAMGELTSDLQLPGLDEAISNLGGGPIA